MTSAIPTRRALAAAATAVVLAGACSSNGPAASRRGGTTAAPSTVPMTASTTPCRARPAAGTTARTVRIDGRSRIVRVHVPSGATSSGRVPLVLDLHGSGSDARGQEAFSGMDTVSDAHRFVVAYPQAAIHDGRGFDWNVPNMPLAGGRHVPAGAPNDVTFLTALVSVLEQSYCIDPSRVYATGFSGGARLVSQLGCDTSDVFAAIAPVSGLRYPTPCAAARAMPVLAFHGTADPVDPYNGHGQRYWTYSVAGAARAWAHHDQCTEHTTTSATAGAPLAITRDVGCAGGATVQLDTIVGEGHEWPGGPRLAPSITRPLGPQSTAINAGAAMWTFFARYSLPNAT